MDFILGAFIGALAMAAAVAVSMAKAAKESDEIENELLRGGIENEEE